MVVFPGRRSYLRFEADRGETPPSEVDNNGTGAKPHQVQEEKSGRSPTKIAQHFLEPSRTCLQPFGAKPRQAKLSFEAVRGEASPAGTWFTPLRNLGFPRKAFVLAF